MCFHYLGYNLNGRFLLILSNYFQLNIAIDNLGIRYIPVAYSMVIGYITYMPFSESLRRYHAVQSAIGSLVVGGVINSREIASMVGAIPVDISNYVGQMKCVKKRASVRVGVGASAVVYERIAFAGAICTEPTCEAYSQCILRMISENATNLARLPRDIALRQEF